MIMRIRPGLELVWRTPTTLQVGVPEPLAIVENVVGGLDWLVARLRRGATEQAALAIAVRRGAERDDARAALEQLRPVLVEVDANGTPTRRGGDVRVALRSTRPPRGDGAGARGPTDDVVRAFVRGAFRERAVAVHDLVADELPPPGDILVEIADFVVPPRRAQPLMAHDVAHLAIIVADHSIEVSPLIVPGASPCLRCRDLHRYDADEAWPVIASQLVGRRAGTPGIAELGLAAGFAARVVSSPRASAPPASLAYRIDLVTGAASTSAWSFHAECGCRDLPESATEPGAAHAHRPPHNSSAAAAARA